MKLIFVLLSLSQMTFAANLDPTSFPIFLRMGFSSIIDFNEVPQRVVIGDSQGFQIEKLDKSLVLRTLVPYATTNMFVYFKIRATRPLIETVYAQGHPMQWAVH